MSTLVYIQGLSSRGFRVKDNTGAWKVCKENVTIQVDLDAESTKKILAREKANFIRVAAGNSTTASIVALTRRGFRIKNNSGTKVLVKHGIGVNGQSPVTVDLTKGDTRLLLKRNKGAAWIVATGPVVAIRGIYAKQIGFDIRQNTQATGTVTVTTNAANGDTVTIAGKTYTFQTTLTNVDGNIHIGATAAATATNLANAINASGGTPGTDYAAAMTANANVTATVNTNVVTVTAIETTQPGTKGNSLALAKTGTNLTVSGATLTGGADAATANPTKVFEGTTVNVDTRVPFNYQQLRRHHKAWVEA